MRKLGEFLGDAIGSGIAPGLFPHDSKFWTDGENVVFRNGKVMSMKGRSQALVHDATALEQAVTDTESRLYIGNENGVFKWDGTNLSTLQSIESTGRWTLVPFGTFLAMTNTVSQPKIWLNGTLDDLDVPGNRCEVLTKLATHIIAFGTGDDADGAAWCSADNPLDWDATSQTNSAGNLPLRDLGGAVVAAARLGPEIAVYSSESMGLFTFIGQPFVFGFEHVLDGIGAVGRNAVVSLGSSNYGLSRQGIWVTDGTQQRYIDIPEMQEFLQEDVNWDAATAVVSYHDELEQQVIWYYPSGTSIVNDKGVGYNYTNGTWTRYSFGATAADERHAFSYPFLARDGVIYNQGDGDTAADEAFVQSKPLDFEEAELYKRVQHINLGLEGDATLELGAQDSLEDPVDFYYSGTAKVSQPVVDRETPFLTAKLTGSKFKLSSMRVHGEPTGFVI